MNEEEMLKNAQYSLEETHQHNVSNDTEYKSRYPIARTTINLPTKLKSKLWAYSKDIGLPLTQTIVMLLNQALESKDLLNQLPTLSELVRLYKEEQYKDKNVKELL